MMDGRIHRGDCFALRFTSDFAFHCISLSSTEYLRALILVLNCIRMASSRRGALIVVEGLDRAGKSSQCECLRDSLLKSGHSVKYIRFPGIGDIFRIYMDIF